MGNKVKVWIFKKEVSEQILKSPEMQSIIQEKCDEIASQAGAGFTAEVKVGQSRVIGRVKTSTWAAAAHNAKHGTLLKAMNASKERKE